MNVQKEIEKENLTEKIQVLLSDSDYRALNIIIARNTIEYGKKAVPVSEYVRSLIKQNIKDNITEQVSFVGEKINKIITEYKKQKIDVK